MLNCRNARMDSLDHQLIGLLRNDARLSVAALAHKLQVSRGTVTNRIARLEGKKAANERILCEPGIHRDPGKIKTLNRELSEIAAELEKCYADWDELVKRLAAQQAGTAGGGET